MKKMYSRFHLLAMLAAGLMVLALVAGACAPSVAPTPTAAPPAKSTTAPPAAQPTQAPAAQPTQAPTKPPAAKEPVKIGLVASFSGYASVIGAPLRDAVMLMEEETNKAGGINGSQVKVIAYDDESDESKAVLAMKKLINDDKVLALIGASASGIAMAEAPIVEEAQVPWVTQGSTNALLNPPKKWIFKTAPGEPLQVGALLTYMKAKALVNFGWLNQAAGYGRESRKYMEAASPKMGLNPVAKEEYNPTDTDMKPQLTKIKAANPQALVVVGADPAAAMSIRQARELGFTIPVLGVPPLLTATIMRVKELRDGLEGGIFSALKPDVWEQLPDSDPQKKPAADLDKLMRAKYGSKYTGLEFSAAQGYDAYMIVVNAVKRANPDLSDLQKARSQVRDALEQTRGYIGPFGMYNMTPQDHEGYSPEAMTLVQVKDGKPVIVK